MTLMRVRANLASAEAIRRSVAIEMVVRRM